MNMVEGACPSSSGLKTRTGSINVDLIFEAGQEQCFKNFWRGNEAGDSEMPISRKKHFSELQARIGEDHKVAKHTGTATTSLR